MKIIKLSLLSVLFFASTTNAEQICNANIEETMPSVDFIDNSDGTVTHKKTGLMWKVCMEGRSGTGCLSESPTYYDWKEALQVADEHSFAGYEDWRLPNIKELSSIIELSCYQPAINLSVFPNTPSSRFWSSSPDSSSSFFAWYVLFTYGKTGSQNRSNSYTHAEVRLVRGGG